MEAIKIKKYVGIDLCKEAVQLTIYEDDNEQIAEELFPLPEDQQEEYIANAIDVVEKYLTCNEMSWEDFADVYFSMEDVSEANRQVLETTLPEEVRSRFGVNIISRFRAFVEYVFHQERVVWDRNTMLLEYKNGILRYILLEQSYRAKQKIYRAVTREWNVEERGISAGSDTFDQEFSKMIKPLLLKNPTHIIFLTGEGFEGNWMKRTLNLLCSGRRVFLGQNIYSNGAGLLAKGCTSHMEEGRILMQGPDMVGHTIGVVAHENGRAKYVPITTIGKEWFNTRASIDIILDKSQRVDFFYRNHKDNETELASCEIKDLPQRPPKMTRMRVEVTFSSSTEGIIFLTDLGFGSMIPKTEKVTVFPFQLIS